MRVLQYNWIFPPHPLAGGRSNICKCQSEYLARKGHTVTVYTSKCKGFPTITKINRYTVVRKGFFFTGKRVLDHSKKFFQQIVDLSWLKENLINYDIFHVHAPTYGFTFPYLGQYYIFKGWVKALEKNHIPTIVQFHGTIKDKNAYVIKNFLKDTEQADIILTVCELAREQLIQLGVKKEIHLFPGGVDLEQFDPNKYLIHENGKFTILYVSGISEKKGYYCLKKALALLRKKRVNFDVILLGDGLLKIPHKLMPSYYSKADVLVFPSRQEGLPLSIIEAMAMKKPVVATKVGGIPELIINGKNGFLISPNDPKSLASALLKLYEDADLRKRMGLYGRKIVEEKFDIKKLMSKLETFYQNALEHSGL